MSRDGSGQPPATAGSRSPSKRFRKAGCGLFGVRKRAATDDSIGAGLVLDDDRLGPAPGKPVGIDARSRRWLTRRKRHKPVTARAGQSSPPGRFDVVPAGAPARAIANAMTSRSCGNRRCIGFLQPAVRRTP
jgi:hypothetical protein